MQMKSLLTPFCVLFLLSCAKQGFPPGGPEDKTPPEIVVSIPEMGATRVPLDTEIRFRFSETVQPGRAGDFVFITPDPGNRVRLHWRSRELIIKFSGDLEPDRTYVITLGTGIRDYRNNTMKASYILAFSTGDSLDRGEIEGRVFHEEDAAGIGIWAYVLTEAGDPDPRTQQPEYIVQCGKDGSFRFSYLAEERYRLFAVRDRLSNKTYQPGADAIGITFRDADLTREVRKAGPFHFLMTREDTLAPRLLRAGAVYSSRLILQFNESVRLTDQFQAVIEATDAGQPLQFTGLSSYILPEQKQSIVLDTPELPADRMFRVTVSGVRDTTGLELDAAFSRADFRSVQASDTTAPELLSVTPGRYERHVSLNPDIQFLFSETMDTASWYRHIILSDTSAGPVPLVVQGMDPVQWIFKPAIPLSANTVYQITADSLLTDLNGRALADTLLRFTTVNPDTLSWISGHVNDPAPEPGDLFVIIRKTGKEAVFHEMTADDQGDYQFDKIFPGVYTLWGFRDRDENGRYSFGKVCPFEPAERFFVSADTILARSRWNNAGNDFTLP